MDAEMCEAMMGMMGQMDRMPMMGGGMGIVMLLLIFLVVAAIVAVIVFAVRSTSGGGDRTSDALRELDLRYARGEIDRDDYVQRRADLDHS